MSEDGSSGGDSFDQSRDGTASGDGPDDHLAAAGDCAYDHPGDGTASGDWECPHPPHPEAGVCVFHLPVDRRAELGIDPADVAAAFVEAVGAGRRGFVGATLGRLALERVTVEGGNRTPIDLRDATVEDGLRVVESRVDAPVRCDGASFGRVLTTDSAFGLGCSFAGASVDGDLDLSDSRFGGDVDLSAARVGGDLDLTHARFEGRASFRGADLAGDLAAEEVLFGHDASFRGTRFRGRVDLAGAEFTGGANVVADDADFVDAEFEGDADFERATFRHGNFADAEFAAGADFANASFDRGVEFDGAAFGAAAAFDRATVDGDATFAGCRFEAAARFPETDWAGDAVFEDVAFRGPVEFAGTEFAGGSSLRADDANFAGTTFGEPADFHLAVFRYADFEGATFEAGVEFTEATFVQGADFPGATFEDETGFYRSRFEGRAKFADARFAGETTFDETVFEDDAGFDGVAFDGPVGFRGVEFRGGAKTVDDADFSGATFGAAADFSEAEFRYGTFDGARFAGAAAFDEAEFRHGAEWYDAAFDDRAGFYRARFAGDTWFDGATFGPVAFPEATFDDDVSFAEVRIRGEADFRGTEFAGGANVQADDATFEDATLEGEATFDDGYFRHGNFDRAALLGGASFEGVEFDNGVTFDATRIGDPVSFEEAVVEEGLRLAPEPVDDRALVSLRSARVREGVVADLGPVYYDATEATIGEVRLVDSTPETNVFDRILFRNTTFRGFDFSLHRGYLVENDWQIHEVAIDPDEFGPDRFEAAASPDDLETTYLKAKNGAKERGDNKAVSEFFLRELSYRRQQYVDLARDRDHGPADRAGAAGKWGVNRFFDLTCGYGERPSRVFYSSLVIVLAFGVVYQVIDSPNLPTSESVVGPYVYSFESFTTIVLGDPAFASPVMNVLTAFEGFVGAFFIALYVFALTRSIHR